MLNKEQLENIINLDRYTDLPLTQLEYLQKCEQHEKME